MKKSESMLKNVWGKLLDHFLTITILPFSDSDWTLQFLVIGMQLLVMCMHMRGPAD